MRATDVAQQLARMLEERGVALERSSEGLIFGPGSEALVAWDCFKKLATEIPTEAVSDGGSVCIVGLDLLLYETMVGAGAAAGGTAGPDVFHFSCRRQFTLEDRAGEYAGMNEIALVFEAPLAADSQSLADEQMWGESGEGAGTWAEGVETSEPFARFVQRGLVTRFVFDQGEI